MAYDVLRGEVVMFGGSDNYSIFGDTWVWDGTTWKQKFPLVSPPRRAWHSMAYDAARGQVVLFGGDGADIGYPPHLPSDTWVWDGEAWTQKFPAVSPPPRAGFGMAYEAVSRQVVLFGGTDGSVLFDDMWVWDGNTWTEKAPPSRPSARYRHSLVSDGEQVLLFGGDDNTPGRKLNDTWVYRPGDTTPPTITPVVTGALGMNGWYTSPVAVSWNVNDPESAITSRPCDPTTLSADTAGTTVSCSATSAGGTSNASVTIKIAQTPPSVTVQGVSNGAIYTLGAVPMATCSATDALSGMAVQPALSLTGGTPNGVGSFNATCTGAKDLAGNAAPAASVTYSVQYKFLGFFQPVTMGTWNTINAGRTVPMKWQLTDRNGQFVTTLTAVQSVGSAAAPCTSGPASILDQADTSGGSGLRYDLIANQYLFNWQTASAWTGTCRVFVLTLDDGSTHTANFTLK